MDCGRSEAPNQLFTAGALRLRNAGLAALDFFDEVSGIYGVDEEGVGSHDEEGVVIPSVDFQLTEEQFQELQRTVYPLSNSEDFGIDLYVRTLEFI